MRALIHDVRATKKMYVHCLSVNRLTLKLSCDMKLTKFPMDNQTCPVHIQSCEYKLSHAILRDTHVPNEGFIEYLCMYVCRI